MRHASSEHGRSQKVFWRYGHILQNHQHFKSLHVFQTKFLRFCDILDWNTGDLWRAPKVRAKILGYFVGRQHMTSFFSNSNGGKCLLAPPCRRPWLWAKVSRIIAVFQKGVTRTVVCNRLSHFSLFFFFNSLFIDLNLNGFSIRKCRKPFYRFVNFLLREFSHESNVVLFFMLLVSIRTLCFRIYFGFYSWRNGALILELNKGFSTECRTTTSNFCCILRINSTGRPS